MDSEIFAFFLDRIAMFGALYSAATNSRSGLLISVIAFLVAASTFLRLMSYYEQHIEKLDQKKLRNSGQLGNRGSNDKHKAAMKTHEDNSNSAIHEQLHNVIKTIKDQVSEKGHNAGKSTSEVLKELNMSEQYKALCDEELKKEKEKYEVEMKDKLAKKEKKLEEKFKKEKKILKEKYNEDRRNWEEERSILKEKYEQMRWI